MNSSTLTTEDLHKEYFLKAVMADVTKSKFSFNENADDLKKYVKEKYDLVVETKFDDATKEIKVTYLVWEIKNTWLRQTLIASQ